MLVTTGTGWASMRPRPIPRKTAVRGGKIAAVDARFNEAAADTAENAPWPPPPARPSARFNEAAADTAENDPDVEALAARSAALQ